MHNLIVRPHDFERAKEEILNFAQQLPMDLYFEKVEENDFFIFEHTVTGRELNTITLGIQKKILSIYETQLKTVEQFGQIYNALEALDKDYIQGILVAIKGLEKANEDINKIVRTQEKTLDVLKKFNNKLNGYAHLQDVDSTWNTVNEHSAQLLEIEKQMGDIVKIWSDCQKWHQEMASILNDISMAKEYGKESIRKADALRTALTAAGKKTDDLSAQVSQMIKRLEYITAFTSVLEKITHLQDVDSTWNTVNEHSEQLLEIEKKIKNAYLLAGGAAVLAIIEMLLLLR